jgi:hypothetical protein
MVLWYQVPSGTIIIPAGTNYQYHQYYQQQQYGTSTGTIPYCMVYTQSCTVTKQKKEQ